MDPELGTAERTPPHSAPLFRVAHSPRFDRSQCHASFACFIHPVRHGRHVWVSAIHANRTVGKLRELGIAEIRRGDLYNADWSALKDYAKFDPGYFYGDGPLKVKEELD